MGSVPHVFWARCRLTYLVDRPSATDALSVTTVERLRTALMFGSRKAVRRTGLSAPSARYTFAGSEADEGLVHKQIRVNGRTAKARLQHPVEYLQGSRNLRFGDSRCRRICPSLLPRHARMGVEVDRSRPCSLNRTHGRRRTAMDRRPLPIVGLDQDQGQVCRSYGHWIETPAQSSKPEDIGEVLTAARVER